jgi:D-alanine-D-alanine ligase
MVTARVLILYNAPVLPPGHPDVIAEQDVMDTAEFIAGALTRGGYGVTRLGVGRNPAELLDGVRAARPDVVFNLFEGLSDQGHTEAYVAGVLEWLGLPFTGSSSQTLALARHKALTKYLLQGAGLPTAPFFLVHRPPVPACPLEWPVIVKPCQNDASEGIDQGSVVTGQAALEARVARVLAAYGAPVLVERYVAGRELAVSLIANPELRSLPPSEVLFIDPDPGYWPIITYDAKWRLGTRDFDATPVRSTAELPPGQAACLEALGREAFELLGCRDYGRVDFRMTATGEAVILEVNPNPDFSQSGGMARSLETSGVGHAAYAVKMVEAALARGPARPQAGPAWGGVAAATGA